MILSKSFTTLFIIQNISYSQQVYANAQICLNSLSGILGDKKYFFGDELTSFDATLYAYLCPTLKKDFPNKRLESHIKGCSNLVKYVDRITEELFPDAHKGKRTISGPIW